MSYHSPGEIHVHLDHAEQPGPSLRASGPDDFCRLPIDYLLGVILQIQDLKNTTRALEQLGLIVIRLPSVGAFLGRQNITLLVGLPASFLETTIEAIRKNSSMRTSYLSAPGESVSTSNSLPVAVPVGGAMIFTLEVERFEEF